MSMVRQPVPGVHDLVPPEGRVCVELLDDRGRVKQRVRSENAIMNMHQEAMKRLVRGGGTTFANTQPTGYHFHGSLAGFPETSMGNDLNDWYLLGLAQASPANKMWGSPFAWVDSMRFLVMTDSTESVSANENIFPGVTAAYASLRETYAPSTNTKRGNVSIILSYRTPTALRYVCEWGTAYGNGTHNSVGIGNMIFTDTAAGLGWPTLSPYLTRATTLGPFNILVTDSSNALTSSVGTYNSPSNFGNHRYVSTTVIPSASNTSIMSAHWVSNSELWMVVSGNGAYVMGKWDYSTLSANPHGGTTAATGLAVAGPTMTTVGSGTAKTAVTVIGSDLWLAYNGTLKRCVKPTSSSLTVTNTYTPGGIENCVDITTDGTDLYWLGATTVYKINATTGAITTSWTHGLTGTMSTIAYAGTNSPYLVVSYEATSLALSKYGHQSTATARTIYPHELFTTAGVNKGEFAITPNTQGNTNVQYTTGGLLTPVSSDGAHWLGPAMANQGTSTNGLTWWGPSHMSRTVLGSPVVKTSANSMRVTYEFAF